MKGGERTNAVFNATLQHKGHKSHCDSTGRYPNNTEGTRAGDPHILLALAVQEVKFPFLETVSSKDAKLVLEQTEIPSQFYRGTDQERQLTY